MAFNHPPAVDGAEVEQPDVDIDGYLNRERPVSLSRAVYVGVFGDLLDFIAPHTEADPAAILVQLLVMFGNAIGRGAWAQVGPTRHYLNLFVVLVGDSAIGRKGVSEAYASALFDPVDTDWSRNRRKTGLSSGEGLIFHVRDRSSVRRQKKKNGVPTGEEFTEVVDFGEDDKRMLVTEPEFASVLTMIARKGNALSPVLRKAWDGARLETLTKVTPLTCAEPHVSLIGHITRSELAADLMPKETANGFGNRFLWIHSRRQRSLPDGGPQLDFIRFHSRLGKAVENARNAGEMKRDSEATTLWNSMYPSLTLDRDDLFGRMTARGAPLVVRLSCLFALGDGFHTVSGRHLRAALELWRYAADTIRYLFKDSLGDARTDTLLAALKQAGPDGLTQSEILREVFQRHVKADDLARIGAMLQNAGLLDRRPDASCGGRPAMRWFYRAAVRSDEKSCDRSDKRSPSVASVAPSQADEGWEQAW